MGDASMRKSVLCLTIAMIMAPGSGQAQVTVDMTRVTCADYVAMPPGQARTFSAWMSGWFNQKFGYITVGLNDFAKNTASVKQWCTTSPRETVMAALDRSHPQPGPVTGQVKVDMSLITCRQLLGLDVEQREMIASWMSGYFRASRTQPIFDFQKFANNKKAVENYCKKFGSETVMSAIQKNAK
jgi:hypothetical protein